MTNKMRKSKRSKQPKRYNVVLLRREPKSLAGSSNTVATTSGVITHISAIAQGDGIGDRSGDKIFIEHVEFGVNMLATATNNTRFVLLQDKFNLGTAPAVSDIFTSAGVAALFNSLYVTQQKRFKILMDKTLSFSSAGELARTFKYTAKVGSPCYYTGSASTTQGSGSIWLLHISDVATAATLDIRTKVVYSDY